ncbi:hypothetical protein [Streptomyces silaceus]|uniref:hypothetical protein n=1 Tax=Streptomyces silaceus TaxID=545123 RepID=UPI0006EB323F|nr:hypothetical protein [Streptomyces silaceus]
MSVPGARGAALVDWTCGLSLGSAGEPPHGEAESAAAEAAELARMSMECRTFRPSVRRALPAQVPRQVPVEGLVHGPGHGSGHAPGHASGHASGLGSSHGTSHGSVHGSDPAPGHGSGNGPGHVPGTGLEHVPAQRGPGQAPGAGPGHLPGTSPGRLLPELPGGSPHHVPELPGGPPPDTTGGGGESPSLTAPVDRPAHAPLIPHASGSSHSPHAHLPVPVGRLDVEDLIVTTRTEYHVLRFVETEFDASVFLHMWLDRDAGNLAVARLRLQDVARRLVLE